MTAVHDNRWLGGYYAEMLVNGVVVARRGEHTKRGADTNEIQSFVSDYVGKQNPRNSRAKHNLLRGSMHERVISGDVVVDIVLKPKESR